ncbi:MAG: hypothetical protein OXG15_10150 [Gammaproteobacteria bacterium]|nr:hypothetical protein [Gammaproteobacteria bacterium]
MKTAQELLEHGCLSVVSAAQAVNFLEKTFASVLADTDGLISAGNRRAIKGAIDDKIDLAISYLEIARKDFAEYDVAKGD